MSGSTKLCWSCSATTPYEIGWCMTCWMAIPIEAKNALEAIHNCEPYSGAVRLAVADTLRGVQRKTSLKRKPISLDDLEI